MTRHLSPDEHPAPTVETIALEQGRRVAIRRLTKAASERNELEAMRDEFLAEKCRALGGAT